MGMWKWEGLDKNGKKSRGEIQAKSEKEARKILRSEGIRAKKLIPPSLLEFDLGEWMVERGIGASVSTISPVPLLFLGFKCFFLKFTPSIITLSSGTT